MIDYDLTTVIVMTVFGILGIKLARMRTSSIERVLIFVVVLLAGCVTFFLLVNFLGAGDP